ncbi:MAG: threonine--tRNA ligase [Thermoproteota archaeon]
MRALLIHAGRFRYAAKEKALHDAEELEGSVLPSYEVENALVVFVSVERGDGDAVEEVADALVKDISEVASKVRASTVVLYPYAHLSSDLAPPAEAKAVLGKIRELASEHLTKSGYEVVFAPFGWYKEFELHCLGHPLSELSRTYKGGAAARRRVEKRYFVVTPEGEVFKPEEYVERADEEFRIIIEKEALGKELPETENPVNRLCLKFGFEWEGASDHGHMRYNPHAEAMVEAVSEYAWLLARSLPLSVVRVRGTNMFNMSFGPVYEHARLFGDRLYELGMEGRQLVMRYAACHQQFLLLRDYTLSYRDLPMGMFEIADSYRYEQSGEVSLCFRLRRFFMPDLHILVRNLDEAVQVSEQLQKIIHSEASKLGQRYWAVYNVTEDFWSEHRNKLMELIRRDGAPALVAIYPSGIYYWVVNVEYHIVDVSGRPREIATFQFDVGNARRFGIKYVDEDGSEKYPIIIHTALIGSVERYIYMVFDSAAKMLKAGETPYIPTWLAPIQVRIIPVNPSSQEQVEFAEKVLQMLESNHVRADIDDRDVSLGRRIRDAGKEWIPYIAVIGDREVKTGTLNVTIRRTNDRIAMTPQELLSTVKKELEGYPIITSTLPKRVSARPTLVYLEKPVE